MDARTVCRHREREKERKKERKKEREKERNKEREKKERRKREKLFPKSLTFDTCLTAAQRDDAQRDDAQREECGCPEAEVYMQLAADSESGTQGWIRFFKDFLFPVGKRSMEGKKMFGLTNNLKWVW